MSVQYSAMTSVASSAYDSSRQDSSVSGATVGMVCGTTSPPSGARPSRRTSEKLDGFIPPRVDTYCIALVFVDEIANLDNFIAARANAHTGNAHTGKFFECGDVILGVFGQIFQAAGARNIFLPAGEVLVDRLGVVEVGLRHRHDIMSNAVDVVGDTDWNFLDPGQNIEFCHEIVGEAVDHGSMACHDRVVPSGAPRTTGVDTKLATGGAQLVAHLVKQFGGKWAGTNAGRVGLHNANSAGETRWTNTCADRSTTGGGVRRCDERICSVIHFEVGCLAALHEHNLVFVEGFIEDAN